jgi:hypothetical protein
MKRITNNIGNNLELRVYEWTLTLPSVWLHMSQSGMRAGVVPEPSQDTTAFWRVITVDTAQLQQKTRRLVMALRNAVGLSEQDAPRHPEQAVFLVGPDRSGHSAAS